MVDTQTAAGVHNRHVEPLFDWYFCNHRTSIDMARRKRSSQVLEKAQRRAAGMSSIAPELDLGNGMTLETYWLKVQGMRDRLTEYNRLLSNVDQSYNDILQWERELSELSERMLGAVAVKYGRNSTEYEMAGGVRRAERRRLTRSADETSLMVARADG